MSWKKIRYPHHLKLEGWQRAEDVPHLLALLNQYCPESCISKRASIIKWREKGRTYITWCIGERSSIQHYTCLVSESCIRWFKKASV